MPTIYHFLHLYYEYIPKDLSKLSSLSTIDEIFP